MTAREIGLFLVGCLWFSVAVWGEQTEQVRRQQSGSGPAQFQVSTDLVLLSVSVTDRAGRSLSDLITSEDVKVFEDKVEQEILFFSPDQEPLAQGLVLDSSASMGNFSKMRRARAAALHFVRTSQPDDEVFLVDFDSQAAVTLDFSSNWTALGRALAAAEAGGKTALYDAIYLALEKLKVYPTERRKVILLISDGADTASRHSAKEVRNLARESDVQIYAVGIMGLDLTAYSMSTMENLAEVTGGRSFFPRDPRQMVDICYQIAVDLHQQYILGYRSTNQARDGKWRKVKLKIKRRKGWPHLSVHTRQGYYAVGPR